MKVGESENELDAGSYKVDWYDEENVESRNVIQSTSDLELSELFAEFTYDGIMIKVRCDAAALLMEGKTSTEQMGVLSGGYAGKLLTTGTNNVSLLVPTEYSDRLVYQYDNTILQANGNVFNAKKGTDENESVEITVKLLDSTKKVALDSCVYTVSIKKPEITFAISGIDNNSVTDKDVILTFTYSAETTEDFEAFSPDVYPVKINDGEASVIFESTGENVCKGTHTVSGEGSYNVTFGEASNEASNKASIYFTIDKTAPALELKVENGSVYSNNGEVYISLEPVENNNGADVDLKVTGTITEANLDKDSLSELELKETEEKGKYTFTWKVKCPAGEITEVKIPGCFMDANKTTIDTVKLIDNDEYSATMDAESGSVPAFYVDRQSPFGLENTDIIITPNNPPEFYTDATIGFSVGIKDGDGSGLETVTYSVKDTKNSEAPAVIEKEKETLDKSKEKNDIEIETVDGRESDNITLSVSATDNCGNIRTAETSFKVDRSAPTLANEDIGIPTDRYSKNDVTITVQLNDLNFAEGTLSIYKGNSEIPVVIEFNKNGLATTTISDTDGVAVTKISVSASDTLNHKYEKTWITNFVVDKVDPVVTIDDSKVSRGEVSVEFSDVNFDKEKTIIKYYIGTEEVQPENITWQDDENTHKHTATFRIPDTNEHGSSLTKICAETTDAAGRTGSAEKDDYGTDGKIIDTVAPVVTISLPGEEVNSDANNNYYDNDQQIVVTATDYHFDVTSTVTVTFADGTIQTFTNTAWQKLEEPEDDEAPSYQLAICVTDQPEGKVNTVNAVKKVSFLVKDNELQASSYMVGNSEVEGTEIAFEKSILVDTINPKATISFSDDVSGAVTVNDKVFLLTRDDSETATVTIEISDCNLIYSDNETDNAVWIEDMTNREDADIQTSTEGKIIITKTINLNKNGVSFFQFNIHVQDLAGRHLETENVAIQPVGDSETFDANVEEGILTQEMYFGTKAPEAESAPDVMLWTDETGKPNVGETDSPVYLNASDFGYSLTITDKSGIKSIDCEITNCDDNVGVELEKKESYENYEQTHTVKIDIKENYECNDVHLKVTVTNNLGKNTTVEKVFAVDKLAPRITVEYNKTSVMNEKYFKDNRTATITVTDINFDKDNTTVKTEVPLSGWTETQEGSNVWTATAAYMSDGDYTMQVSSTDLAKNVRADANVEYIGAAPRAFTIDEETPKIVVERNVDCVGQANNTDYFNKAVTITVTVTDNYVSEDLLPKCEFEFYFTKNDKREKLTLSYDDENKKATVSFNLAGNDVNTEHGDILSAMSLMFKDPAGNPAEVVNSELDSDAVTGDWNKEGDVWSYKGHSLEVDTTDPTIGISVPKDSVHTDNGVDYYQKTQTVTVTVSDINLDRKNSLITYKLTDTKTGTRSEKTQKLENGFFKDGEYSFTLDVENGQEFNSIEVNAVDYSKRETQVSNNAHFVVDSTAPTAEVELSCVNQSGKPVDLAGFYTNENVDNVVFVKLKEPVIAEDDTVIKEDDEVTLTLTIKLTDKNIAIGDVEKEDYKEGYYVVNQLSNNGQLTPDKNSETNTKKTITYTDTLKVKADKEGIIEFKLQVKDLAGNALDGIKVQSTRENENEASTTYTLKSDENGLIQKIFSLDRRPSRSDDSAPKLLLVPDKPTDKKTNGGVALYSDSFNFALTVQDAKEEQINNGEAKLYCSGIKSVEWKVEDSTGVVEEVEGSKGEQNGTYKRSYTIPITLLEKETETNNVTVTVIATDNNGNKTTHVEKIAVDNLAPRITVEYDNNSVMNEKYFKANRTATITVTDINFDKDNTTVKTEVPLSGWTETQEGSNVWTATAAYMSDGDYTMQVSSTDLAKNVRADANVDYIGAAPRAFTIDKTPPVITVSYNNNAAMNGKYYNAGRVGTINILEHNFRSTEFKSAITASLDGVSIGIPTVNGWSRNGDNNGASVNFTVDGDYTMVLDYTDLAGNPAATYTESPFTVDTTPPEITINITDYSANSGNFMPEVVLTDVNFDASGYSIPIQVLTGLGASPKNFTWSNSATNIHNGVKVTFVNLQKSKSNDGVYILTAKITDLAGNETIKKVTFSVNRFGSTYIAYDQSTAALLASGYGKQAPTLCIQEINPNAITNNRIVLSVGSDTITLEEGKDYTVEKTTGKDNWNGAIYTIFSENFVKDGKLAEGDYEITLYSEDGALNVNSNRTNKSGLPIRFTLDASAPVVSITGVMDGDRIRAESREITLYYSDSSGIKEIIIYLDGEEYMRLTEDDIAKNPEFYTLLIDQSNSDRVLSVMVIDAADNEIQTDDITFFLNGSWFQQYLHNTPLLIGSIAGVVVIGAGIFFVIKRKKKMKEA